MSDEISEKELEKICVHAQICEWKRGKGIFCKKWLGKNYDSFGISQGEVCIATTLCNSGHMSPDGFYTLSKIYCCEHRTQKEGEEL